VESGSQFVNNIKISRNQQITCLHVKNATAWVANVKHQIVRKDTLLFDYIYFLHPTAIGHWCALAIHKLHDTDVSEAACLHTAKCNKICSAVPGTCKATVEFIKQLSVIPICRMEMMFPLYSILKSSTFEVPDVNLIMLHLKRAHLIEWARAVMATVMSVKRGGDLPPILLQEETDIATEKATMALQGVPKDVWVCALDLMCRQLEF
jgi:hypothetical protein